MKVDKKNKRKSADAILKSDVTELGQLLIGMHEAYNDGKNAMEYARKTSNIFGNTPVSTLIAYDLQAGTYIEEARKNKDGRTLWCNQLANILSPYITNKSTILEVGCGEATTLAGVIKQLDILPRNALGFDISWSRCVHGKLWLEENQVSADLFVGDLFEIPLEDSSVDIVYTSHSLEPNGGQEEAALKELLRIAKRTVVLVEPIYEMADEKAKMRMREHGYVRNLKKTAELLGATVKDYRLLDYCGNPLNPSGLVLIEKEVTDTANGSHIRWRCPLTHTSLVAFEMGFYSQVAGVVYPVLGGVPLLRSSHAVVASSFNLIHG